MGKSWRGRTITGFIALQKRRHMTHHRLPADWIHEAIDDPRKRLGDDGDSAYARRVAIHTDLPSFTGRLPACQLHALRFALRRSGLGRSESLTWLELAWRGRIGL